MDKYYRDRSADLTWITVPALSATNWGHHLHTRGGFEGYNAIPADQKWLEVHGQQHWVEFYTDYGLRLQKRFFGHFLKDEDTGWHDQPPVFLNLRRVDGTFAQRAEIEWPLTRTGLGPPDRCLQHQRRRPVPRTPGARPERTGRHLPRRDGPQRRHRIRLATRATTMDGTTR
ncbi:hypothetical protein [Kribbella sp. NPDC055071]